MMLFFFLLIILPLIYNVTTFFAYLDKITHYVTLPIYFTTLPFTQFILFFLDNLILYYSYYLILSYHLSYYANM